MPLAWLYGAGVLFWQWLYDAGLLKRASFSIPVISIGNLSVGGSGKTPHTEYLARYLHQYINVATLSRGYRRKTTGFKWVLPSNSAQEVGDEPLQIKRKYPDLRVAVGENRLFSIPRIMGAHPDTHVILLDDAYQHLAVKPGLNLLLTEYGQPFFNDYLLPAGNLREHRAGYDRADAILVTKCPEIFSEDDRFSFLKQLNALPHQKVFFSRYVYGLPYSFFNVGNRVFLNGQQDVLLVTGIADPAYMIDHVRPRCASLRLLTFPDHHYFEKEDAGKIVRDFMEMPGKNKIILTTEKDAVRLEAHGQFFYNEKLPIFVLPLQVSFLFDDNEGFNNYVKDWLLGFKS